MRIFILFAIAAALAGCATPAERAAQSQREIAGMMQIYGPACTTMGYQTNTDAWRNCILRLDERDTYLRGYMSTTTCTGSGGFLQCSTF